MGGCARTTLSTRIRSYSCTREHSTQQVRELYSDKIDIVIECIIISLVASTLKLFNLLYPRTMHPLTTLMFPFLPPLTHAHIPTHPLIPHTHTHPNTPSHPSHTHIHIPTHPLIPHTHTRPNSLHTVGLSGHAPVLVDMDASWSEIEGRSRLVDCLFQLYCQYLDCQSTACTMSCV